MMTLKNVVARFVGNLYMDTFPESPAEIVDFGFNNTDDEEELFAAYRTGLVRDLYTAKELNDAVGDGPMLQSLLNRVNPSIKVVTDYDMISDE